MTPHPSGGVPGPVTPAAGHIMLGSAGGAANPAGQTGPRRGAYSRAGCAAYASRTRSTPGATISGIAHCVTTQPTGKRRRPAVVDLRRLTAGGRLHNRPAVSFRPTRAPDRRRLQLHPPEAGALSKLLGCPD